MIGFWNGILLIGMMFTSLANTNVTGFQLPRNPLSRALVPRKLKMTTDVVSEVIHNFVSKGEYGTEWSLIDLSKNILKNNVDFASVIDNVNIVVALDSNHGDVILGDNLHYIKTVPHLTTKIIDMLTKAGVDFNVMVVNIETNGIMKFVSSMTNFVMMYFFIVISINVLRTVIAAFSNRGRPRSPGISGSSGGMNPFSMLQTGSSRYNPGQVNVTFADVAGCDEAKDELVEVVDFLKSPQKYKDAGAIVPKGILLEGPPGTGKTLLARATAGEAGVNFISASGSEFIEMFVGVGASRIRDMFNDARRMQPCIVFIDEIDAIGRQRGNGFSGGNDERDQTLNQLLTNMDGFEKDTEVVVMASTNRADILDKALVRSGRFDRKVKVALPDREGRKDILKVHLRGKKNTRDVDFEAIYDLTPGFSGADLQNLVNEAAIMSVRRNTTVIDHKAFLDAYEKMTIGIPKNKDTRDSETLEMVAYHESGHAIAAKYFNEFVDVRKITIQANINGAGGYTLFTPKERYVSFPSKKYMFTQMVIAMAGRAAEIVLYEKDKKITEVSVDKFSDDSGPSEVTFGSSGDVRRAMEIAKQYISVFGARDGVGAGSVREEQSELSRGKIDERVAELIQQAETRAVDILRKNKRQLSELSTKLLREKTVDGYFIPELTY
jgi:cell division protease FtsH